MPLLGVAAPEYGVMTFVGLRTKKTYSVDIYYGDVADALINWDGGAGASATSPDSWTPPEPVLLIDCAIVTGGTDTKKFQLLRNNAPTGGFLRHTLFLNTLSKRAPLSLGFQAGSEIRALQKA